MYKYKYKYKWKYEFIYKFKYMYKRAYIFFCTQIANKNMASVLKV